MHNIRLVVSVHLGAVVSGSSISDKETIMIIGYKFTVPAFVPGKSRQIVLDPEIHTCLVSEHLGKYKTIIDAMYLYYQTFLNYLNGVKHLDRDKKSMGYYKAYAFFLTQFSVVRDCKMSYISDVSDEELHCLIIGFLDAPLQDESTREYSVEVAWEVRKKSEPEIGWHSTSATGNTQ
jgi:hypothetical protein